MTKSCEFCSKPLSPTAAQWKRGHRTTRKRFCDRSCAAQFRAKDHRTEVECPSCKRRFLASHWRLEAYGRQFCSQVCYQQDHATTPKICQTCEKSFVSYSKRQKYCSKDCTPSMEGANNPNYGKRHPGMCVQPAHRRQRFSLERRGPGNPRWNGGTKGNGKYSSQTFVRRWTIKHLGNACVVCKAPSPELHHIVPRRLFQAPSLANFAQNLILLCTTHHRGADRDVHMAKQIRDIPFADRLPESILATLEQDGLVSAPLTDCDYSPLGTLSESLVPADTTIDTPSSPA